MNLINTIIDAFFIGLIIVVFGTIIWYNITETSKARKQLRQQHRTFDESASICLRPDGLGRLALLGCVNRWLVFVFLLTLVFAATTHAQDDSFDPTESYRTTDYDGNTTRITPSALGGYKATDSEGNVTRIRPSALGGYKATDSEGNVTRIRPSALGGYNATDSEGNVTRIRPSALGGYNATDSEGNTTRIKPTGFGSRSSYDRAPIDADSSVSSSLGPVVPSSPSYVYSRHSSHDTRHSSNAEAEEEGFAAASGKCGDITTQKIGNFYYHSDGGVTQKVGNFLYGPDGEVTQKIGNFYHHSDGTTTQQIGNFYYDSDGGVTQKIGSFYYHSGGKPCEDGENE